MPGREYTCTTCRTKFRLEIPPEKEVAFCPACGAVLAVYKQTPPAGTDKRAPEIEQAGTPDETVDMPAPPSLSPDVDTEPLVIPEEIESGKLQPEPETDPGTKGQAAAGEAAAGEVIEVENLDNDMEGLTAEDSRRAAFERIRSSIPPFIDKFKILRKLGSGGMGIVYLAWEPGLRRHVALKVLRPDLPPNSALKFLREAQITGQLTHPGIMPVYHLGRDKNTSLSYYTMKYVTGRGLSDMLKAGNRPERQLRSLLRKFVDVCNAVAFAHSRNVIHCDLKPDNVWIGAYGEIMILDWGLARVLGRKSSSSSTRVRAGVQPEIDVIGGTSAEEETDSSKGRLAGTPAYMSPEQARGEFDKLTSRSDIYSLGVILYEILTGKPPVEAVSLGEMLEAIRNHRIIPPHKREPNRFIPPELSAICLRAMAFSPVDRYRNARQMAREINSFLEGEPQWALVLADGFNRDEIGHHWVPVNSEWEIINAGVVLKSRGSGILVNAIPIMGDVAIECEAISNGAELSFYINAVSPFVRNGAGRSSVVRRYEQGYCVQFGADGNICAKISRNGIDVAINDKVRLEAGRKYHLRAERRGSDIRLWVDGRLVLSYRDSQPLIGRHVGLFSSATGTRFEWVRVYSRGSALTVSLMAVPNAFFKRGLWQQALEEYRLVAATHPNRRVGWLAHYRAGLCLIRMKRFAECDDEFIRLAGTPLALYAMLGKAQRNRAAGQADLAVSYLRRIYIRFQHHSDLTAVDDELWDMARATEKTRPEAAAAAYELVVALERGNGSLRRRAALWLVQYHESRKDYFRMLVIFGKMLELESAFDTAVVELRAIARNPRRFPKATILEMISRLLDEPVSAHAAAVDPVLSSPSARLLRSLLLLETGLYREAIAELDGKSGRRQSEKPPFPHYRVAEIICRLEALRKLDKDDDAVRVGESAMKDESLKPYRYLLAYYLAKCERARNNFTRALELAESGLSEHKAATFRISARILAGTCLYFMGEIEKARQLFLPPDTLFDESKLHQRAQLYLGIWFSGSPESRAAQQYFRAARETGQPVKVTTTSIAVQAVSVESSEPAYSSLADHFLNRRPSDKLIDWLKTQAPAMIADELCFLAGEFYRNRKLPKIAMKFFKLTPDIGPKSDWPCRQSELELERIIKEEKAGALQDVRTSMPPATGSDRERRRKDSPRKETRGLRKKRK